MIHCVMAVSQALEADTECYNADALQGFASILAGVVGDLEKVYDAWYEKRD